MGFFIFIVVAGIVIYNVLKNSKANQEQWRIAAERLGLGYNSGDFGLTGTISGRKGGHRIVISTFSKSGGNDNSTTYTKYHIDYQERIPIDFKISRQNALHTLGHALGLKDIETGNPSFDDCALVRGMRPHEVRQFLTPDRQAVITDLMISFTDVVISNEMIELNKPRKEKDAGIIIRTVNSLLSVCNDLTDRTESVAQEAEQMVDVEPVEPSVNPLFTANPIVPDPFMVEVEEEPLQIEIVDEPSVNAIAPDIPSISDDPVVEVEEEPVWVEKSDEPVIERSEGPPPVPAEPLPLEISYDVVAIAQDLYGGSSGAAPSAESRFDEVYADQEVSGFGTVLRLSKVSYDPVFKGSQGVKVTCELCELSGAYSKFKVRADVVFSSERYDELKNKIGSALPIPGKLIAQNSTMHHLYILSE